MALALALPSVALAGPPQDTSAPVIVEPPPPTITPSPVYATPGAPDVPSPAVDPNRGLGLTIVGFSVFATPYLISAVVGGALIDDGYGFGSTTRMGKALLVPAIGPFMAIPHSNSYAMNVGLVVNGLVQLAGLGMGIGGAVMLGKTRRQARLSASAGGLSLAF